MKIRIEHIEKEHQRLIAMGITGYRDVVLREAVKHPDGQIELTPDRYKVVSEWKAKAIANPSAPPTPRYETTASALPAPVQKKKRAVGARLERGRSTPCCRDWGTRWRR